MIQHNGPRNERIHWSTSPLRVDVVLGTRAEAVKLVPVVRALRDDGRFRTRVVLTGEQRDIASEVLVPFGVFPDVELEAVHAGQSMNELIGRVVPLIDAVLQDRRPDLVLVQGDTASAFCGALAGFHREIRVGHVDAGFCAPDPARPFPEECYRRMIGVTAALHFAPTAGSAASLAREGISAHSITVTGSTGVDALLGALELLEGAAERSRARHSREEATLVLVALQRQKSAAQRSDGPAPLSGILRAVADAARAHPDVDFVYPVDRNPRARRAARAELKGLPNVACIDPLSRLAFVGLLSDAHVVVTDSAAVEEEAPTLGVPVLVLHDGAEPTEGSRSGRNGWIGTARSDVREALEAALASDRRPVAGRPYPNPFGDGRSAERIRDAIACAFRRGPPPAEFSEPCSRSTKVAWGSFPSCPENQVSAP